jgi:hypothetical protein
MATKQRKKTFQEVLREEAPRSAWKLETKARCASWIAKIQPEHSCELYPVKHAALRQLFRIPAHAPVIRDAWTTSRGFLLSVRLKRTGALLHVPFNELNATTRQQHGSWIARRARGRWWQTPDRTQRSAWGVSVDCRIRSAR